MHICMYIQKIIHVCKNYRCVCAYVYIHIYLYMYNPSFASSHLPASLAKRDKKGGTFGYCLRYTAQRIGCATIVVEGSDCKHPASAAMPKAFVRLPTPEARRRSTVPF